MNFKFTKALIFCIILSLLLGGLPCLAEESDVSEAQRFRDGIIEYELKKTDSFSVQDFIDGYLTENAGVSSEWFAIALSQNGEYDLSSYGNALAEYLCDNEINSASTRLKMILSLIAADCGEEYINKTLDESIGQLGIMSRIFGIHAINNGAKSNLHTLDSLSNEILAAQLTDGGWGINGKSSDVDTTAMTIQALAANYSEPIIKNAIDKGIEFLSSKQQDNGGFVMYGVNNPESVSQVIIALSALGIDCERDERFIKNGNSLLDVLSVFLLEDGSFAHIEGGESNANATVQVLCATVAYIRMHNEQQAFFILDKHNHSDLPESSVESSADSTAEESDISESDTTDNSKEKSNPKIWLVIAVISVALILCAILLICKAKSKIGYAVIAVITLVAVLFIAFGDIKTADEYYNGANSKKENVVGTVTLSIKCDVLVGKTDESHIPKDGIILTETTVDICDGDTAYSILREIAAKNRIPIETNGIGSAVYVEGIANIYEFNFGDFSGWNYYVNGKMTNLGCGEYKLSDGDKIEWVYTCELSEEFENLS